MGKYDIGVRVSDPDGDEGVIIDKRKGERFVRYDTKVWLDPLWWEKRYLAVVEPKPAFKVGDRVIVVNTDYSNAENDGYSFLENGNVGTVSAVGGCIDVKFDVDAEKFPWAFFKNQIAPFTLEAGRFYRTRDGKKVGPMEPHRPSSGYPWQHDGGKLIYLDNGVNYEGEDSPHTIVGFWIEPATEAAQPAITIEVGKFYRTRDGRKVGPIRVSGITGWPWQNPDNSDTYRDDGTYGIDVGEVRDEDLVAEWAVPWQAGKIEITWVPKVGDKIKWLGKFNATMLTPGSVYEIKRLNDKGWVGITDDNQARGDHSWDVADLVDKFERVAEPAAKFKVGDRVRIIGTIEHGVVASRSDDGVMALTFDSSGDTGTAWWRDDELELAAAPSTDLLIGNAVTATGYISGANGNNFSVVFGDRSYDLPATLLKKAA